MVESRKWTDSPGIESGEYPADALRELSTTDNTLSFWIVDDSAEDWWKDAALALASNRERLDGIELAFIGAAEVQAAHISIRMSPGDTPVLDIVDRHVDFEKLDQRRYFEIASAIGRAFGVRWRKLNRTDVKLLIKGAIADRRVEADSLPLKLRSQLV